MELATTGHRSLVRGFWSRTPEVEAFLAVLAVAPVLVREYVPHVTHTDDYPSITVELRMSRDSIVFFSQSQGVRTRSVGGRIERQCLRDSR